MRGLQCLERGGSHGERLPGLPASEGEAGSVTASAAITLFASAAKDLLAQLTWAPSSMWVWPPLPIMTIMILHTYQADTKMLRDLVGRWAGSLGGRSTPE